MGSFGGVKAMRMRMRICDGGGDGGMVQSSHALASVARRARRRTMADGIRAIMIEFG